MSLHDIDDLRSDRVRNRIFQQLDIAVQEANTQTIGNVIGEVSTETLMRAAVTVSRLRAAYLKKVIEFEVSDDGALLNHEAVGQLRLKREAYKEALHGFGAIRHALKRGYFDLS